MVMSVYKTDLGGKSKGSHSNMSSCWELQEMSEGSTLCSKNMVEKLYLVD